MEGYHRPEDMHPLQGLNGTDVYFLKNRNLPECYIDKGSAKQLGWEQDKGNLWEVLPGRLIGGDRFFNNQNKLPIKLGRLWFEADINFQGGYRGRARLMVSNDGLFFVSYDHFETFMEVY